MSAYRRWRRKITTQWKQAQRNKQKNIQRGFPIALDVIPPGQYCYGHTGQIIQHPQLGSWPEFRRCPYWSSDPSRPDQENGFCELLGKGDWQLHSLLWDQVKECSINNSLDHYALADDKVEEAYKQIDRTEVQLTDDDRAVIEEATGGQVTRPVA